MGIIIQSVANYAPWIYAVCGLVALYQLYKIWLVRAERKQAVFSLEREKAAQDTYHIFAVALSLLVTMGGTYFVSNTLAEAVEPLVAEAMEPTPAIPFVPTPTNTPLPATPTPTWTPTVGANQPIETSSEAGAADSPEAAASAAAAEAATAEVAAAEDPAPTATPAPVVQAPVCPDNRSILLRPGQNETVSGVVNVIGTATHENFQYYKIEYAQGANAGQGFAYLNGGEAPVTNGVLISTDTTAWSNGPWTLRLIVVDQTGNFPEPCRVTINVQN